MTDLEINKALALAIGWRENQISRNTVYVGNKLIAEVLSIKTEGFKYGRTFDYLDWRVIGPIAERYDCFPHLWLVQWEAQWERGYSSEDTPQKAIALAVIEGAKK